MEVIEGIQFFPEIESILMMDSSSDFRLDYDMDPITVGSYKIAPWGCDNLLPNHLLANISKNDIVSTNLRFNRDLCFGLGPKLIKVLARNKKGEISEYEEVTEGKEFDFFERNDEIKIALAGPCVNLLSAFFLIALYIIDEGKFGYVFVRNFIIKY